MGKVVPFKKPTKNSYDEIFIDVEIYPDEVYAIYDMLDRQISTSEKLCELDKVLVLNSIKNDMENIEPMEEDEIEDGNYYYLPIHIYELQCFIEALDNEIENYRFIHDLQKKKCLETILCRFKVSRNHYKKQIQEFFSSHNSDERANVIKDLWDKSFNE